MLFLVHRMSSLFWEAVPAAIILTPLFLFLQQRYWKKGSQTVLYLLFALYLCGMYAAAGLPAFTRIRFRPRLNFTFFAYMFSDYRSSLLNVLFFMPLGFLLPTIWKQFRTVWRTVLFSLGASLLIELAQLLSPRATDVNDLITNTVGGILGYAIAMILQWLFPALQSDNESRDVYWICGIVLVTMFFLHPIICSFLY